MFLFFSQRALKELNTVHLDFLAKAAETGQVAKCTAMDSKDNNCLCCPAKSEIP